VSLFQTVLPVFNVAQLCPKGLMLKQLLVCGTMDMELHEGLAATPTWKSNIKPDGLLMKNE